LSDFNDISYVGRLWCPEMIPDLTLSDPLWGIRCTHWLTIFISEKHILWTHFGENVIDIWVGADFDPYSSQSFQMYF
jgi:hypothetical protein